MIGLFCRRSRNLKKFFNYELQFWCSNIFHSTSHTQKPYLLHSPAYIVNNFSTCHCFFRQNVEEIENFNPNKMIVKKDGTVKKKKKPTGVKVYILNEKGISSSMFFHEAEKLAQRQRLQLKKVEDVNGIAAYKLITISDLLETNTPITKDDKKKDEKIKKLIISKDINPHDFEIKVNHIRKFLDKGMKVFVKLGDKNNDPSKLNALYGCLEKALAEHSLGKTVTKSGYLINIVPKPKISDSVVEEKKS